jgi:molybdopterin adenylyltransferase
VQRQSVWIVWVGWQVPIDESIDFTPIRVAVLTISDTRSRENDVSGDLAVERLTAMGHEIADRAIVPDHRGAILTQMHHWVNDRTIPCIITTGGTGVTGRDVTPEALKLLEGKEIPGFGEMFRWISYQTIGTSAIQSRAIGYVVRSTYIFALPGSPGAVKDAFDHIFATQLDNRHRPCNFIELIDRLREIE